MAQYNKVDISLWKGLDTKTDPKIVQDKFISVENADFQFPVGALSKRAAFITSSLTGLTNSTTTGTYGLAARGNELIAFQRKYIQSYSPVADSWVSQGYAPNATIEADYQEVIRNDYQQTNFDCDFYDFDDGRTIACSAWEDSRGGIRYSIWDNSKDGGGTFLISDQVLNASGTRPRVFANTTTGSDAGSKFFLFYAGDGALYRKEITFSPSILTSSAQTYTVDASTGSFYDITKDPDDKWVILRKGDAVGGFLFIYRYSQDFTVLEADSQIFARGIGGDLSAMRIFSQAYSGGNRTYAVWNSGTLNAYLTDFPAGLDTTGTDTLINSTFNARMKNITSVLDEDGNANLYWDYDVVSNAFLSGVAYVDRSPYIGKQIVSLAGTTTYGSGLTDIALHKFRCSLAGDAIRHNGMDYVPIIYQGTNQVNGIPAQSTYFLSTPSSVSDVSGSNTLMVAKMFYTEAGIQLSGTAPRMPKFSLSGSTIRSLTQKKGQLRNDLTETTQFSNLGLAQISFNLETQPHSVEVNNTLYFGGGFLGMYNGSRAHEDLFHLAPDFVLSAQGSGTIPSGTYRYKAVYEAVDAQGNRHLSSPNFLGEVRPEITGSTANHMVLVKMSTFSNRPSGSMVLSLYRTEDNGEIFYKVAEQTGLGDSQAITFNVSASDDTILSNDILYTNGGEFSNNSPPACHALCVHRNRMFLAASDQASTIWFSKPFIDRYAVEFSALQTVKVPEEGGRIIALASLNDYLVIFKKTSVYILSGDGPDANGGGTPYFTPFLLSNADGAQNRGSVVRVPQGLMFQSRKGISLLDGGLNIQDIGSPVDALTITGTIVSSQLLQERQQVRFGMTGSSDLPLLVYDYGYNLWSTYPNLGVRDTAVIKQKNNTTHHILSNDGSLIEHQSEASFSGSSGGHSLRIETGWMNLAGINGFLKVKDVSFIGEYRSPCRVRLTVYYDFDDTIQDANDVYLIDIGAISTGNVLFRRILRKHKTNSIKFVLEDVSLTDETIPPEGEGFVMTGISLGTFVNDKLWRQVASY